MPADRAPARTGAPDAAALAPAGRGRRRTVALLAVVAIAIAGGLLGFLKGRGQTPVAGGPAAVVARINGQPITTADVDSELVFQMRMRTQRGQVLTTNPDDLQAFRRDILDQLVDQWLMMQAASAAGLGMSVADSWAELPQWATGLDLERFKTETLADGVPAEALDNWANRQVTIAHYLRTDAAQQLGRAETELRGGAAAIQPVQSSDIAAALQRSADITFLFGAFGGEEQVELRMAREGELAPDFALKGLDGAEVKLSDFRGQPVLINFWATWCGPCRVEMPLFAHLYERNKDEGLVVLAVDVQEPAQLVTGFVAEFRMTFPVVLDHDGQVSTLYRVRGLPTTFFVDAEGVVQRAHRGAIVQRPTLLEYVEQIFPGVQAAVWPPRAVAHRLRSELALSVAAPARSR